MSWYLDETYVKVGIQWRYLYRSIGGDGNLLDSLLSEHRDRDAARRFLRRLLSINGTRPERVTTDHHPAHDEAIRWRAGKGVVNRRDQYLNNRTEQDHRGIKQRYYPMRGFANCDTGPIYRPTIIRAVSCQAGNDSRMVPSTHWPYSADVGTPPELLGTKLFDLTGRVALVTGAGRGLGRTIAIALAAAGADIVASARTQTEIVSLASEVTAMGRRAKAITCDVTSEASCEGLVDAAVAAFGRVDVLVNNAGINVRKPVLELGFDEYKRVLATNLHGYFLCAKAAGRRMVEQRSGKVINVSSIMGRVALPEQSAYASSKGAIEQLTKVLALEWAAANVQVNALGPAYFETELTRPLFEDNERHDFIVERTPMRRWGQPHELCGAVIFLASGASDYITGHTLVVDGGWTAW